MSLLLLAGLGLDFGISDEKLKQIEKCKTIFLENYTNLVSKGEMGKLKTIFQKTKKGIIVLGREQVENEKIILDAMANGDVALLVSGDPLIATTHHSLVLSAKKANHKTKIIHSSSIISAAISESMLQVYKFGKIVTIPFPRNGFDPTSPYENIGFNLKNGLHTLLLLDIDSEKWAMPPNEAFEILEGWEKKLKKKVITEKTKLLVLSSIGKDDSKVVYGTIVQLRKLKFNNPPHCLILPAKLHFMEEELLAFFCLNG